MSFVEAYLPKRLNPEDVKPWNPFHNGWTSVREGDWKWFGSRPARMVGFGATGVTVIGIFKMLQGDVALPFGYPRRFWLGHLVGLSLGVWAGSAYHDVENKARLRIDLTRELRKRQRVRDITEQKEARDALAAA